MGSSFLTRFKRTVSQDFLPFLLKNKKVTKKSNFIVLKIVCPRSGSMLTPCHLNTPKYLFCLIVPLKSVKSLQSIQKVSAKSLMCRRSRWLCQHHVCIVVDSSHKRKIAFKFVPITQCKFPFVCCLERKNKLGIFIFHCNKST